MAAVLEKSGAFTPHITKEIDETLSQFIGYLPTSEKLLASMVLHGQEMKNMNVLSY